MTKAPSNRDQYSLRAFTNQTDVLIKVEGRLSLQNVTEWEDRIAALVVPPIKQINVDLKRLAWLDSYALGMLIQLNSRAEKNKQEFRLLEPTNLVRSVLESAKIHLIMAVISGGEAEKTRAMLDRPEYEISLRLPSAPGQAETGQASRVRARRVPERRERQRYGLTMAVFVTIIIPEETIRTSDLSGISIDVGLNGMYLTVDKMSQALYAKLLRRPGYLEVMFTSPFTKEAVKFTGRIIGAEYHGPEENQESGPCNLRVCCEEAEGFNLKPYGKFIQYVESSLGGSAGSDPNQ